MRPFRVKAGLAHLDRQLVIGGELLTETHFPCFVLDMFISLVIQLLVVFDKVHNSLRVRVGEIDIGYVPLLVL